MNHMLFIKRLLGVSAACVALATPVSAEQIQLRIIQTGDVQAQLTDYDYLADQKKNNMGLTRAAKLIQQARKEVKNSIYVDNGNLLQGSPMGDYAFYAKSKHPAYVALEKLDAVASVVGHRELSHGLPYLDHAIAQTHVPVLSANVFNSSTKAPRYKPYVFKIMQLQDDNGKKHRVKVAFLGFTPPQVVTWYQQQLGGEIMVSDIVATAKKYVPLLKDLGADVIVVLNQSGLGDINKPYALHQENTTYELSKIKGIDAIVFGHEQGVFPSPYFTNMANIDPKQGTIHHVAATQMNRYASHIGIIDLTLDNSSGSWQVMQKYAHVRPVITDKPSIMGNHWRLKWAMRPHHRATRAFVAQPMAKITQPMFNHLANLQDDAVVQLVNQAQSHHVQQQLHKRNDVNQLPILSATDSVPSPVVLEQGDLSYRQLAQLYPRSDDTIAAVKVNGNELKEWLECSASAYQQIQPHGVQDLMHEHAASPQVIDGVAYEIDIRQPARYDRDCQMVNAQANRIKNLQYKGKTLDAKSEFVVATHQAAAKKFAGVDKLVYLAPVNNQEIVRNFAQLQTQLHGAVAVNPDNNWRLVSADSAAKMTLPDDNSTRALTILNARHTHQVSPQQNGKAVYRFQLNQ